MARRGSPFGRRGNLYRNWRRGETRRAVNAVGQALDFLDDLEDEPLPAYDIFDDPEEVDLGLDEMFDHENPGQGLMLPEDNEDEEQSDEQEQAQELSEEEEQNLDEDEPHVPAGAAAQDQEEENCVICGLTVEACLEDGRQIFRNVFCGCRGSFGIYCGNCIIQTALWRKTGCQSCRQPWNRNALRFFKDYGPMNLEDFASVMEESSKGFLALITALALFILVIKVVIPHSEFAYNQLMPRHKRGRKTMDVIFNKCVYGMIILSYLFLIYNIVKFLVSLGVIAPTNYVLVRLLFVLYYPIRNFQLLYRWNVDILAEPTEG